MDHPLEIGINIRHLVIYGILTLENLEAKLESAEPASNRSAEVCCMFVMSSLFIPQDDQTCRCWEMCCTDAQHMEEDTHTHMQHVVHFLPSSVHPVWMMSTDDRVKHIMLHEMDFLTLDSSIMNHWQQFACLYAWWFTLHGWIMLNYVELFGRCPGNCKSGCCRWTRPVIWSRQSPFCVSSVPGVPLYGKTMESQCASFWTSTWETRYCRRLGTVDILVLV